MGNCASGENKASGNQQVAVDSGKKKKTTVLVCGGGNAAHVLAGILGSKPEFEVRVLTMYADEAERWTNTLKSNDGKMKTYLKETDQYVEGTPALVTKDPAKAVPGADWVIIALPSTLHQIYLEVVAKYAKDGVPLSVGALSPHGGFDLGVRDQMTKAGKSMEHVTMYGTYELPWACRIDEFGHQVTVLGIKKEMELVVVPGKNQPVKKVVSGLQDILQVKDIRLPKLLCEEDVTFLPLMLDGFWHGSIMYGEFKDWDGKTPFDEKPLFYQGVSDETGELMVAISDEIMAVKAKLESKYPKLNLSYVAPTQDWFLSAYGDMIGDKKSGFGAMLRTNSAYDGLTHPMVKKGDGWVPDFKHRYMVEDLFMGIANIKSMADLVGLETPETDKVIQWCESKTGSELIVDGKFKGKDVKKTRTPQRYGYTDLKKFMNENGYAN